MFSCCLRDDVPTQLFFPTLRLTRYLPLWQHADCYIHVASLTCYEYAEIIVNKIRRQLAPARPTSAVFLTERVQHYSFIPRLHDRANIELARPANI